MNKSLLKELPSLVTAGIISQETAQRIIDHYQQEKQSAPNSLTIILGILGAILAGSGILLIIAHNWDDLSVPIKTILSFLPLILAQLTCAYTLSQQRSAIAWRECSSLFLFFSIGACISLISQIYQVNGSLSGFLLIWVLLALPLVYLLSAATVALFCIAGITWYASIIGYLDRYNSIPYMYVIVLLLIVPHYYKLYKNKSTANFYHWLNWFVAISITAVLGCFVARDSHVGEWIFLLYCILFCVYYCIGRSSFFQSKKLLANPFLLIGTMGIVTTLLTWSYRFLWNEYKIPKVAQVFNNPLFYLIAAGFITIAIITWSNYRKHVVNLSDPTGYSFAILMLLLLTMHDTPIIAVFIINAWIIFIGVFFIRKGASQNHLGIVNLGLLIIAAVAVCRFFDDHIPFVWRGIFFLATGIAFFTANYMLMRKRKQQPALLNRTEE